MAGNQNVNASEEQARELVEQSRQADWEGKGFLKNLFLGDFRMDWIDPFPNKGVSAEYLEFEKKLEDFLKNKVDSVKIDATGEYGDDVIDGFRKLGAFGMKISKEYGGLGFTNVEYCRALELVGRYDGNVTALLSAHQSIGIPSPLKYFGTPEQKQKYLTRCAAGAVSAFALTEPDVGSDPARLGTQVTKDENGDYIITGEKLWCSNGTIAELFVVMARDPNTNKISAFIVESDPNNGVEIAYRCRFMGLRALQNGVIKFHGTKVPKENIIGKEGAGLKIALTTLNTGRLSIPAACVGASKMMVEECRKWSADRVQWGQAIGKHEVITHKLIDMAAMTYGMESLSYLATELSEVKGYDIRLEASAAKEWCTTRGWTIIDEAMQIKGGRGYETEASLKGRGEHAVGIERAMRDSRINRIFEGSSEIMHLMMARECVDKHLQVAGAMLDKKATIGKILAALPSIAAFYIPWYAGLWIRGLFTPFRYGQYGRLAGHVRFVESRARKLAREVFHGMAIYQAKMERKQAFMFRAVDIAMELTVMAASVARANGALKAGAAEGKAAVDLADVFCKNGRRYVDTKFAEFWDNDDDAKYAAGKALLDGKFTFLEPKDVTGSAASSAAAAK